VQLNSIKIDRDYHTVSSQSFKVKPIGEILDREPDKKPCPKSKNKKPLIDYYA
jgi:hypothetical protein